MASSWGINPLGSRATYSVFAIGGASMGVQNWPFDQWSLDHHSVRGTHRTSARKRGDRCRVCALIALKHSDIVDWARCIGDPTKRNANGKPGGDMLDGSRHQGFICVAHSREEAWKAAFWEYQGDSKEYQGGSKEYVRLEGAPVVPDFWPIDGVAPSSWLPANARKFPALEGAEDYDEGYARLVQQLSAEER